jgi:hypothetical protein
MTIEPLKSAYNARPFRPFVMHLADGRQIAVEQPEFMASAPSGRTVMVYQPDDMWDVVDLLLVTDLGFKPAPGAPAKRRTS